MSVPARLSLVTLGVADVEEAAAFYERLGWTRSSASVPGVIAFFATGGVVVGLWNVAELAAEVGRPGSEAPAFRAVAVAMNVESEAEVDRVIAEALAAGATLVKPAERADWGGYSGYFGDPDGHAWEVAYNPGWPLDDKGLVRLP